ncbi:lysophospholipase [Naviculisporaceae sp. PSN 640]
MLTAQAFLLLVSAITFSPTGAHLDLQRRGNSDAPNGYAPAPVPCPEARPTVRPADSLSEQERAWLEKRDQITFAAMQDALPRLGIVRFDVGGYLNMLSNSGGQPPRLAIAVSGGGYRALMNGAGALAAFDDRTAGSTGSGQVGGILQAATYLTGLSGGSCLVGSLYTQNFTTVESIINAEGGFLSQLWQFNDTILRGPAELRTGEYYRQLNNDVDAKVNAGFNTSITDFWGRALSYQLVNASDGGPGYTYSSIATDSWFTNAEAPLPLIVAIERSPGLVQILPNSSVIEFNPWEMGSFDQPKAAFVPLKYVGSAFDNGEVPQDGECVAGVDNVGFVVGTSSSLFNQAFLQIGQVEGVPDFLINFINNTLTRIGTENRDVAVWPNPFYQYNSASNPNANSEILTLVDGGEGLENIPLHPLLWKPRNVDVTIAVDSSADTPTHWPNGTSLVATYQKSLTNPSDAMAGFPSIPDQNTFINLGLNSRPTFFGCEIKNMSKPGPLIVYLPNVPYSTFSNVSTFDLEYSTQERNAIVQNGYNVASRANGTVVIDEWGADHWPECLACAILWRSFDRSGTQRPQACVSCFAYHCWDGEINSTSSTQGGSEVYAPGLVLGQDSGSGAASSFGRGGGLGQTMLGCLYFLACLPMS